MLRAWPEAQRRGKSHYRRAPREARARAVVSRVTADTNVYISALNFGGMPERLLRSAKAGAIQRVVSEAILAEVGKVLRGDKFRWPEAEIKKAQQEIASVSERVEPTETLHIITADPADNRILECAAAAEADYIVTGDNHLLRLKQFRNRSIVKVADFLDLLTRRQAGPPGRQR